MAGADMPAPGGLTQREQAYSLPLGTRERQALHESIEEAEVLCSAQKSTQESPLVGEAVMHARHDKRTEASRAGDGE
jgi:phage portal protein BeeE